MNEPFITLTGNIAFDPQGRTTPNGVPVVTLRVASTRRFKAGEDWQDGETVWFDVICWKQLADNVCTSLHKGDRITVEGRLSQKSWVREDGTTSTKLVIDARSVGLDLSRYGAKVIRPIDPDGVVDAFGDKYLGDRVDTFTGELPNGPLPTDEEIAA